MGTNNFVRLLVYYTRKDLSIEYKFIFQRVYQFHSVPR